MGDIHVAFFQALDTARVVLASPQTGERWDQPSVLARFSVRGLAGHLVRAATTVLDYLNAPEPDGDPIPVAAYLGGLQPAPDVKSPTAASIRERGEAMAAAGRDALMMRLDSTRADLARVLAAAASARRVQVYGEQVMRLDDYLLTRMVELAVHTDDLPASVGLPPPALPRGVADLALPHLLEVARFRNGDVAVLRAFSRRERDDAQALRIF